MSDTWHVYPIADVVQHSVDRHDPECICGPSTEPVKRDDGTIGWVIVHHSLDGREQNAAEDQKESTDEH